MSGMNQYGNKKHKQACLDLEKATQSITQALQHEVGRNQELCVLIRRLEEREAETERSLTEQVEANSQLQLKITELQKHLEEKDNSLIQANQTVALLTNELRDLHQQLQTQHSQNCVVQEVGGGPQCEDSQLKAEDAPISAIKQEDDGEYGHYTQSDGTDLRTDQTFSSAADGTDLRTDQTFSSAADIKAEQMQEVDGRSGMCPALSFEPEQLPTDAVSQAQLDGLSLGIVDDCSFGTHGTSSGDAPLEYRNVSSSSTSPSRVHQQQNTSSGARPAWHDSVSSARRSAEALDQPGSALPSALPQHSTERFHSGERRYSQSLHTGQRPYSQSLNPGEQSYSQSLHTGQRPYSQSLNPGQQPYSQLLPAGEGSYSRHRSQLSRNFRHKNSNVSLNHHQQQQQQQIPPTTGATLTGSANQKKPSLNCSYCGRAFSAVSKLIIHQRVHTGERPFVCTLCGRTFNQKFNLAVHQRVHTGERPYPCAHCGKSFSRKPDLRMHVRRIHTGEKPFSCHLCGRSFSNRTNLKTHLQTHLPKHR